MLAMTVCHSLTYAQKVLQVIFEPSELSTQVVKIDDWQDFQDKFSQLSQAGFQLTDLELDGLNLQKTFWGTFKKSALEQQLTKDQSWDSLQATLTEQNQKGWYLQDIEGVEHEDGSYQFVGLWKKEARKQQLWKMSALENTQKLTKAMNGKGMYLRDIETYSSQDGKHYFLMLFEENIVTHRTYLKIYGNPQSLSMDRLERHKSGYQMFDTEQLEINGKPIWLTIYGESDQATLLNRYVTAEALESTVAEMEKIGLAIRDFDLLLPEVAASSPVQAVAANYQPANQEK